MTDLQIRYFLTAARCLNFTEAARQLYISQPALSQQIQSLEQELNMQLFVRMKKRVYLTPAAKVLLKELPKYEHLYDEIIEKAHIANQGFQQSLHIALMEGQIIPESWLEKFFAFRDAHPEMAIEITSGSIGEVRTKLLEDEVDIAYLPWFEMYGKTNLDSVVTADSSAVVFMSKKHPLANEDITDLVQLKNETILMLREEESSVLYEFLMNDCKRAGFTPHIRYVNSLDENILYAELGMGIGISNNDSYAKFNPNIKVIENLRLAEGKFVLAWKKDNMNTAINLFANWFKEDA